MPFGQPSHGASTTESKAISEINDAASQLPTQSETEIPIDAKVGGDQQLTAFQLEPERGIANREGTLLDGTLLDGCRADVQTCVTVHPPNVRNGGMSLPK